MIDYSRFSRVLESGAQELPNGKWLAVATVEYIQLGARDTPLTEDLSRHFGSEVMAKTWLKLVAERVRGTT